MKKSPNVLICLLFLIFCSCQEEENTVIQNPAATLNKTSALTSLLSRVAQNPTTFDDLLDNCEGLSVQLPVVITLDYQTLTIQSSADFAAVRTIKNQSLVDDDFVHFNFPITVMLANFQELIVNSQQQLQELNAICDDNSFHEIACIDVNFPIKINLYNSNSQISNSVSILSNAQLYNLIAGFDAATLFNIVYPVAVTTASGESLSISNNEALQRAIENSIGTCDAPENNLDLTNIIESGTWYISYFLDEGQNITSQFGGYNYTFIAGGAAVAVENMLVINGNWNIYTQNGLQKLNMNFEGDLMNELENGWEISEYTPTQIQLKRQNGNEMHYMNFAKN